MARNVMLFPSEVPQRVPTDKLTDSSIDDYVAFLAEVFPETSLDVIIQYLLQYRNVEETLTHLRSFEQVKESFDLEQNIFDTITELFPECDPDFLLCLMASNSGLDLYELCDLIIQQLNAVDRKPIPSSHRRKKFTSITPSTTFVAKDNSVITELSFREALDSQPKSPHGRRSSDSSDNARREPFKYDFGVDPPEESAEHFRILIDSLFEERSNLYIKAAKAFAQSNLHGRSAASYYSQQARNLTTDIEEYRKLAAYATFLVYNPDPYSYQLDLHGLSVAEALPLTSAFLKHHLRDTNRYNQVVIVTGSGRRSKNGIRLRPEVYHLLKTQNWRFNFDSLCLFIVFRK